MSLTAEPIRLLFIATFPPPEGGQRLIFQYLYDDLIARYRDSVSVSRIDLSVKKYGKLKAFILLYRLLGAIVRLPFVDCITFQAPYNYVHSIGILISYFSRFLHKPLVLRRSAGNGIIVFEKESKFRQYLLSKTILNTELAFYETKYQSAFFQRINSHDVCFMSNCRPFIQTSKPHLSVKPKRFLFLGQIIKEKGIHLLIEVFGRLRGEVDVELNIYGNNRNQYSSASANIFFHAPVPNTEIYDVICKNDVLVLPSNYPGEGYPGVIIEAFMMNKPVIATALDGIKELVEDGVNGLLIEPENVDQLMDAIRKIYNNIDLYNTMAQNIYARKQTYSTEFWTDYFVNKIRKLVK